MLTNVSIVKGTRDPDERQIKKMVEKAVTLVGGFEKVFSHGEKVLIKPNIAYLVKPGETEPTDPRVARAVYDLLSDVGAIPIIGESSSAWVDDEKAFKAAGYFDLREHGYKVVTMKGSETITVEIPGGVALKRVKVHKLAIEVDSFLSLPVIKTHDHDVATLSLKNMKGLMPDSEKKNFHKKYGLFQAIADLNLVFRPKFSVVDGIFCREGMGYPWSEEIEMDLILAGEDPVAVDAITMMIMGLDPKKQKHGSLAAKQGIGTNDIDNIHVVGNSIDEVKRKFKTAEEVIAKEPILKKINIISDEKTCTGCRGMMHYFLKRASELGKLDRLRKYTFVLGDHQKLPDLDKENTLLIGVCTEKYSSLGRYVPGCPPLSRALMEELKEVFG